MKTTLDILIAARGQIAKPENWCVEALAHDADGVAVMPRDASAVSWCANGALMKIGMAESGFNGCLERASRALGDALGRRLASGWGVTAEFNNTHTHAEVLALFDKAIATERAKLHELTPQVKGIIKDALTAADRLNACAQV